MKSEFDKRMIHHIPFKDKKTINAKGLSAFIEYWAGVYSDDDKPYEDYINESPSEERREALFKWKNGTKGDGKISASKTKSIEKNYPVDPPAKNDLEDRYLNHKKTGGAVWNIFYLHTISPKEYPIFDQHVYRAMYFMMPKDILQSKVFTDLQNLNPQSRFEAYKKYREFYKNIESDISEYIKDDRYGRRIDRALFCFGKCLMSG